jgi:hypothetical protein
VQGRKLRAWSSASGRDEERSHRELPTPAASPRCAGDEPIDREGISDGCRRTTADERTAHERTADERTADERTIDERTIDERTSAGRSR